MRNLLLGALLCAAAPLSAQSGLYLDTADGSIGSCKAFDCTPLAAAVSTGDTVRIRAVAQPGAFVAILASGGVGPCTKVPGIENALLLRPTDLITVAVGLAVPAANPDCAAGATSVDLVVPRVREALAVAFQAVAGSPLAELAFTGAIMVKAQP